MRFRCAATTHSIAQLSTMSYIIFGKGGLMLRSIQPLELDPLDERELEATLIGMVCRTYPLKPLARFSKILNAIKRIIQL
jgi:hypothetical protein